jgi:hypothetical protein
VQIPAVSRRSIGVYRGWLLDHLVDASEQLRWHVEAERLGGFEVDREFELNRRLNRQIGCLRPLEDAIHVAGGAAELIDQIGTIGNKTAAFRDTI